MSSNKYELTKAVRRNIIRQKADYNSVDAPEDCSALLFSRFSRLISCLGCTPSRNILT